MQMKTDRRFIFVQYVVCWRAYLRGVGYSYGYRGHSPKGRPQTHSCRCLRWILNVILLRQQLHFLSGLLKMVTVARLGFTTGRPELFSDLSLKGFVKYHIWQFSTRLFFAFHSDLLPPNSSALLLCLKSTNWPTDIGSNSSVSQLDPIFESQKLKKNREKNWK